MTSLFLNLGLLLPFTFLLKGFAMAQDGKDNTFLKVVLVTSPASNMSRILNDIINKNIFIKFKVSDTIFGEE